RGGWEPQAVLNWLALAGWGAKHDPPPEPSDPTTHQHRHGKLLELAPDSTKVMNVSEMIKEVCSILSLLRTWIDTNSYFALV
ncbi:hypothetical protein H0H93_005675, partial [Arthromyces matolae]